MIIKRDLDHDGIFFIVRHLEMHFLILDDHR